MMVFPVQRGGTSTRGRLPFHFDKNKVPNPLSKCKGSNERRLAAVHLLLLQVLSNSLAVTTAWDVAWEACKVER